MKIIKRSIHPNDFVNRRKKFTVLKPLPNLLLNRIFLVLFLVCSASELLEFVVQKHLALSMKESSHFDWSPFVSLLGSETIHADESSLIA